VSQVRSVLADLANNCVLRTSAVNAMSAVGRKQTSALLLNERPLTGCEEDALSARKWALSCRRLPLLRLLSVAQRPSGGKYLHLVLNW
jgi:hypothetical protein